MTTSTVVFFGCIVFLLITSCCFALFGGYWYFNQHDENALAWFVLGVISLCVSFISLLVCICIIKYKTREPKIRLVDYYDDN